MSRKISGFEASLLGCFSALLFASAVVGFSVIYINAENDLNGRELALVEVYGSSDEKIEIRIGEAEYETSGEAFTLDDKALKLVYAMLPDAIKLIIEGLTL